MKTLLMKLLWYKIKDAGKTDSPIDNVYDDDMAVNITDLISSNIVKGIAIRNNLLTLGLKNLIKIYDSANDIYRYKYIDKDENIEFEEQDQIKVFARWATGSEMESSYWQNNNEAPSSSDLLGIYYVIEFNPIHRDKSTNIILKCADKTYVIFNRTIPFAFTEGDKTTPRKIQKIIRLTCEAQDGDPNAFRGTGEDSGKTYYIDARLNSERTQTEIDDGIELITHERRTIKEDGVTANTVTAFPKKAISMVWKPVYEWINELSQIEHLNTDNELNTAGQILTYGRPFIYWIDELNRFRWVYPSQTEPTQAKNIITIGTNTDIINVNLTKKVFDITNMIIYNAGKDMNDVGITGYAYEPSSDSKVLKMTYMPMEKIALDMIKDEYAILNEDGRDSGDKPQYPAAYNHDMAWGTFTYAGTTYAKTVTSDATYNASFRAQAKKRAEASAKSILQGIAHARWRGNIEMKGKKMNAGDLIKFTDSSLGLKNELLRIIDVRHNFQKGGWFTSISVEKDAKALIAEKVT